LNSIISSALRQAFGEAIVEDLQCADLLEERLFGLGAALLRGEAVAAQQRADGAGLTGGVGFGEDAFFVFGGVLAPLGAGDRLGIGPRRAGRGGAW
jgi:hypothetical protein